MNFGWWTFALQAANFLILVWILQHFLFKPVKAIVARRKEEISRALAEAAAEKDRAEKLKQALDAQRSQIEADRQKLLAEGRALLSVERQKMMDDARADAVKVHDQALKRLEDERASAADQLFENTVVLATNIAQQLLREAATSSMERPFLARMIDYIDRLPEQERVKLFAHQDTEQLQIMTAHPLSVHEQNEWREQLASRLGANSNITFDADPSLIAGAIFTFPNAILRFNWRDSLAAAMKTIHSDEHAV